MCDRGTVQSPCGRQVGSRVGLKHLSLECALDSGQFQAAVLTGCWAWRSSYCAVCELSAAKRRTKGQRTALGNGTASSAVAPSLRPDSPPIDPIFGSGSLPQAGIAGHLTFQALAQF